MKARYLYKAGRVVTNVKRWRNRIFWDYSVTYITYDAYNKCNCDHWHICNCDTTTKQYEGYLLEETNDVYPTELEAIQRSNTIDANKLSQKLNKQRRTDRITNWDLNYIEKKRIKKWWTLQELINKKRD